MAGERQAAAGAAERERERERRTPRTTITSLEQATETAFAWVPVTRERYTRLDARLSTASSKGGEPTGGASPSG
jgi:hypothetical protein